MDIVYYLLVIIPIPGIRYQFQFRSGFESGTGLLLFTIKHGTVSAQHIPGAPGESLNEEVPADNFLYGHFCCLYAKMKMIGHQTPGEYFADWNQMPFNQLCKGIIVGRVIEQDLFVIALVKHMVEMTGFCVHD